MLTSVSADDLDFAPCFVGPTLLKVLVATLTVLCMNSLAVSATPSLPGSYSSEQFDVRATRGSKAAMRDGVRLSVDTFRPDTSERKPAILIITPYSNNPGFQKRATWFAKRGYVVAIADSRGRYDSEGAWDRLIRSTRLMATISSNGPRPSPGVTARSA